MGVFVCGLVVLCGLCAATVEGSDAAGDGYVLVWGDEFDGVKGQEQGQDALATEQGQDALATEHGQDALATRPDEANWGYERGFVRNEELQWYRPENAWCEGGMLIIEGRRERVANPGYEAGGSRWQRGREFAEYTSACLLTRGKRQWLYGRFVMRGRIDVRGGLWPAWWTLGSARGWPGCGEIDIMEYYRGMLLANACWGSGRRGPAVWDDLRKPVEEFGPGWAKAFHVWRMDWDAEWIRLYVDDVLLNEVDLSKTINGDREGANPFHEPHYMLLNLAIGGTNGGDPSGTEFPARFEVDYVRVYQK